MASRASKKKSSTRCKLKSSIDKPSATATKIGFFDLFGELRNDIYRHSLLSATYITIDSDYRTPALLQTNAKIRKEASSIYYLENKFVLTFPDFSCKLAQHFAYNTGAQQFWRTMIKNDSVTSGYTGIAYDWQNLLEWLKKFYHHKMWKFEYTWGHKKEIKAAQGAFEIVARMRKRHSWQDVVEVLASYKAGMEAAEVWRDRI